MTDYRNSSTHAVPLASGRPLAPGESGPANPDHPHDHLLIEQGDLIKVDKPKEQKK